MGSRVQLEQASRSQVGVFFSQLVNVMNDYVFLNISFPFGMQITKA